MSAERSPKLACGLGELGEQQGSFTRRRATEGVVALEGHAVGWNDVAVFAVGFLLRPVGSLVLMRMIH